MIEAPRQALQDPAPTVRKLVVDDQQRLIYAADFDSNTVPGFACHTMRQDFVRSLDKAISP